MYGFDEGVEDWYAAKEALEERLSEDPRAKWLFCPLCGSSVEIEWIRDGQAEIECTCGAHYKGFLDL